MRRGHLFESFRADVLAKAGLPPFVQDNQSLSSKGTLRGLHYQLDRPQAKLVRVIRGAIYDVAVDIRRGSPTFGRWFGRDPDRRKQAAAVRPGGVRPRLLRAGGDDRGPLQV